jgi:hypothetical protein
MKYWTILSLSFLLACATDRPAPSVSHVVPVVKAKAEDLIFPYGRYRHLVELEILGERGPHKYSFEGIVDSQPDQIQLVALSPFHTTLMTVTEDRLTGEIKTQAYMNSLVSKQDKFTEYYSLVRQILILSRKAKDSVDLHVLTRSEDSNPLQLSVRRGAIDAIVELSDYQEKIPREIEVKDPHFSADIKVEPLDPQ